MNQYPNNFRVSHNSLQAINAFSESEQVPVAVAGRVISRRNMGRMVFFHIRDGSGQIQGAISQQEAPSAHELFNSLTIGDIVGISGYMFRTRHGEVSVRVQDLQLLTPNNYAIPEELTDTQIRYRHRELDLIVNQEVFQRFRQRSQMVMAIRNYLSDNGFLEVETPILMNEATGANARPFITHHNALGQDMVLRIAPELALKRMVVGGFDRVFELNRNFRNEGVSTRHNPEFTMCEVYQAYTDYIGMMDLTEQMIQHVSQTVFNGAEVIVDGQAIDLNQPFRRVSMGEVVSEALGCELSRVNDIDYLRQEMESRGIELGSCESNEEWGYALNALFEELVEASLIQPTFITDYPIAVSPLARRSDNPEIAERFELFIGGRELANGFSELNDPIDQLERFNAQRARAGNGDMEAMGMDEDYINALNIGLPPTGGMGIGIDRLCMLFTNQSSIREVILFPALRNN